MATGWPTQDDVCAILRLQEPSVDATVVESARLAAINYVIGRVDPGIWGGLPPLTNTAVPDGLYEAALLLASRWYRRRDSLDGTIGWGDMGVVRVGLKDPDVEALIGGYMAVVI
ncbi:MAG TPA: hypothetical protein VGF51_07910 [Acidimicrobiales bacterium]|jgi:hypothetical protein